MIGVGGLAGGMTNQNSQVTVYNSPFGGTIAYRGGEPGSDGRLRRPECQLLGHRRAWGYWRLVTTQLARWLRSTRHVDEFRGTV
jgi:hypothetical protein